MLSLNAGLLERICFPNVSGAVITVKSATYRYLDDHMANLVCSNARRTRH